MGLIGNEEILARVYKFKLFRSEGNLFIDIYEALVGNPAHKFVAVPNLIVREAGEKYFGVGDSKRTALADCLKKIKGVPLEVIVPFDDGEAKAEVLSEIEKMSKQTGTLSKLAKMFQKRSKD